MLVNMKMPTLVGIFIFISRENFMLSGVEHEKSFITSGPEVRERFRIALLVIHLHQIDFIIIKFTGGGGCGRGTASLPVVSLPYKQNLPVNIRAK